LLFGIGEGKVVREWGRRNNQKTHPIFYETPGMIENNPPVNYFDII